MFTNYKITDKPMEDMTILQYAAIIRITNEIRKYKYDNKPMVVIQVAEKKVEVEVVAKTQDSEVEALEKKVDKLKQQKAILKLEADTAELDETNKKIEAVKKELASMEGKADVDDSEVEALKEELASLENKALSLQIEVATGELQAAKEMEESLNDTAQVNVDVETGELASASEMIDGMSSKLIGLAGTVGS